jgi:hypothetical protein
MKFSPLLPYMIWWVLLFRLNIFHILKLEIELLTICLKSPKYLPLKPIHCWLNNKKNKCFFFLIKQLRREIFTNWINSLLDFWTIFFITILYVYNFCHCLVMIIWKTLSGTQHFIVIFLIECVTGGLLNPQFT